LGQRTVFSERSLWQLSPASAAISNFELRTADRQDALAMAWMSQLAYETRLPDKIRAIGALYGLVEIIGKKRERRGQIRKRA